MTYPEPGSPHPQAPAGYRPYAEPYYPPQPHPHQYQQPVPYPQPHYGYRASGHNGLSTAGMTLGIVSLVTCFVPFGLLPAVIALVGLPISCVGRSNARNTGAPTSRATAGIVCTIITLIIAAIALMMLPDYYFSDFAGYSEL